MNATIKLETRQAWLRKVLMQKLKCAVVGQQMLNDYAAFDGQYKMTIVAMGSAMADEGVADCIAALGGLAGEW